MSFVICLWRSLLSRWTRPPATIRVVPSGWRVVEDHRDVFAEFCAEYIKEDLLLWAQLVLPASGLAGNRLAYYAATWDFLSPQHRIEAQNLLKGVKGAYLKALDLRELAT